MVLNFYGLVKNNKINNFHGTNVHGVDIDSHTILYANGEIFNIWGKDTRKSMKISHENFLI